MAIIEALRQLTDHFPEGWVFPRRRPPTTISKAAINSAYRRLGIDTQSKHTGRGWRACARTLLHEQLKYPPDVIEHQLAHAVPGNLGRAYNRTEFLDERRKMMQEWADYLDSIAAGDNVVRLFAKG